MNRKLICQLTSGHDLDDERIFHRFAVSAARMGFVSCVVGPSNKPEQFRERVKMIPCPMLEGSLNWPRRVISLFYILWWSMRNKADIYQIHDPDLLPVGLLLRLFGRTVVYDVHDDYQEGIRTKFAQTPIISRLISELWWIFEKAISSVLSKVFVADSHLSAKFNFTDTLLLGNYPMLDFIKKKSKKKSDKFGIIYVGGVTRVRGLAVFASALELIKSEGGIRVDIVGPCRDEALRESLVSDPRVNLHGKKDWRELHEFYLYADLGIALYQPLPAFEYYPGENSVKIIEYMAAGIPVLTSNFKGLNNFVVKQGIGITVDPTSAQEVADAILAFLRNPDLASKLGEKGRLLFETKYNWDIHEFELKEIYDKIIAN